ncbi:hypothetical protein [Desulfofalx alkaliphila]|nr:hypothetical protein [Desulfofalx alkaliphila]
MEPAQIYIYKNSVYFLGKVKDVRRIIAEYAKAYQSVKDLINAKLS